MKQKHGGRRGGQQIDESAHRFITGACTSWPKSSRPAPFAGTRKKESKAKRIGAAAAHGSRGYEYSMLQRTPPCFLLVGNIPRNIWQ